ncbi:MAG: methyltransferase domain-containing protein [Rhodospirillales bacterium]
MTSTPPPSVERLSLRDPAGELYRAGGRIIRLVNEEGVENLKIFLDAGVLAPFREKGSIIGTRPLDPASLPPLDGAKTPALAVEHDPIPFPSYAYEWPAEMLHAAGELTLDLARACLKDGIGLKDAKPDNVMFDGPTPVFIDALSFERRTPGDPIWRAGAQFVRTFILPLLTHKELGLGINDLLLTHADGLKPEEVNRLLPLWRRLAPGVFGTVTLPALFGRLAKDSKIYRPKILPSDEKARFIMGQTLAGLGRNLGRVTPPTGRASVWSDYMETSSYDESEFRDKEAFVSETVKELAPKTALDVGCNTGHFSRILAGAGASVVAIDLDPVVAGETWKRAKEENLDILPLVQNLARPSPGAGWRNREQDSFLSRARGRFDVVVMLAVIHHMMVSDGIPLDEILSLAAELTRDSVIIEFIPRDDPMFQRILRGRDELYADYSQQAFEAACREKFEISRRGTEKSGQRTLYWLRLRQK